MHRRESRCGYAGVMQPEDITLSKRVFCGSDSRRLYVPVPQLEEGLRSERSYV